MEEDVTIKYYTRFDHDPDIEPKVTVLRLRGDQLNGIATAFYVHDWTDNRGAETMVFGIRGKDEAPEDRLTEDNVIVAEVEGKRLPFINRSDVVKLFGGGKIPWKPYNVILIADHPQLTRSYCAQFHNLIDFMQGYASACQWLGIDYRPTYHSLTDGSQFYEYH